MKAHPAVPAVVVMRHLQGSKNRMTRNVTDAENIRKGIRALRADSLALRASLEERKQEGEIAILEAGEMVLEYVLNDLVASYERNTEIEQAFQAECLRWLNRKRPGIVFSEAPAPPGDLRLSAQNDTFRRNGSLPASKTGGPVQYVPSTAEEVPTPELPPQGHEEPTKHPSRDVATGFYTMENGVRVFVNAYNEPVAPPKKGGPELREITPGDEAFTPLPEIPAAENGATPLPEIPAAENEVLGDLPPAETGAS